MAPIDDPDLNHSERRRALILGVVNGVLWSIGNGLTTGPAIYYQAQDLGSRGFELSLLLATPMLAGLFRLFSPEVIHWAGNSKRACVRSSIVSYLLLIGLPLVGVMAARFSPRVTLATMISLICAHQLLEFIASVALWTWLADLVPLKYRGRYFAVRQMFQLAVLIPTILLAGQYLDSSRALYGKTQPELLFRAYSVASGIGVLSLLASIVPLALMPATAALPPRRESWLRSMSAPFRDRRFARLLVFRTWFSFANGISQTAQNIYPKGVLGLGVRDLAIMRTVTQVGQMAASPLVGYVSDRVGNRPVIMVCQVFTTAAMLFFVFATREHPWILLGAWILFIAYVGHNICLPNLMLKLAPPDKSPYVAAHEALAGIFHAIATVLGGLLFDWLKASSAISGSPLSGIDYFAAMFWIGLVMRGFAIVLMGRVEEDAADGDANGNDELQ